MLRLRTLFAGALVCAVLGIGHDTRAQEPPRGPTAAGNASGIRVSPPVTIDGTSATNVQQAIELQATAPPVDLACTDGQVMVWDDGVDQAWECGAGGGGGGGTVDGLTADTGGATTGANVSVLGGTNGIDTVRSGDTVTLNLDASEMGAINVGTATALASNPTDCGAGLVATAIAANGDLTCGIDPLVDVSDDTTPTLGGNLALAGFDLTGGGDATFAGITYDTATSTCADSSPWECGVQLLSMTGGTPENADANTLRFYNQSGIAAIFGPSGKTGNIAYTDGATVVDNEICRMDSTTGEKIQGATGTALSDVGLLTLPGGADSGGAHGVVLTQETVATTPIVAPTNTLRLAYTDWWTGLTLIGPGAGDTSRPVIAGAIGAGAADEDIVRYDGTTGLYVQGQSGTATISDIGALTVLNATSSSNALEMKSSALTPGGVRFREATGLGSNHLTVRPIGAANISTNYELSPERMARVGTTGTISPAFMAVSDASGAAVQDTCEEVCDLAFLKANYSADFEPACISGTAMTFGNATTALLDIVGCSDVIPNGDTFQCGCVLP